MQRDVIVKGRGLGGVSDLTLLAPIKSGFIESLETVTFKTRVKRVLDALHGARLSAHEYAGARLLSDAVERVGVIHSVRVAVLEPEDKVLLAVTFDGSWESYIRVLWEKVGALLDVIFCSTTDYVTAYDHSFEEWLAWAKRVQVETGFFYGPPDFTAQDVLYHRRIERMRQRGLGVEINELHAVSPPVERLVPSAAGDRPDDAPQPVFNPNDPREEILAKGRETLEMVKNGLLALGALYRMTDLFRPRTDDGNVLRAAALGLLREFVEVFGKLPDDQQKLARKRFDRQLSWLFPEVKHDAAPARTLPPFQQPNDAQLRDVQGGILEGYDPISHGLLLLLAFDGAASAHQFLRYARRQLARASDKHAASPGRVFHNLAFTLEGLRACGLDDDELEQFPDDFRQGMAARAGALGDVRGNHPRRWRRPAVFVGLGEEPGKEGLDLQAVHAVFQLRVHTENAEELAAVDYWNAHHPLQPAVKGLLDEAIPGLRLLAIQSMKRNYRQLDGRRVVAEHFGYVDGEGQPDLTGKGPDPRNHTRLGEILHGWNSAADFAADPGSPRKPEAVQARPHWLANGSFLVVRKYQQNVPRLRQAVDEAARQIAASGGSDAKGDALEEARRLVYGKMMGRHPDGDPLLPSPASGGANNFNYDDDRGGKTCPLHAHIRRANPRTKPEPGARPARILRRGMSYGPPVPDDHEAGRAPDTADRGLVFMAYNASLSEQFETVQRWLVGGNSTGASSGQSCPIMGVRDNGYERRFRFTHTGDDGAVRVANVLLESLPQPFLESEAITRLDWGLYLFAPSLTAVAGLERKALLAGARLPAVAAVPWRLSRGRELLLALREAEAREGDAAAIAAWKAAIEDPEAIDRLDAAALWAAIREDHGGILRTPYGVLVASRELQLEVYGDRDRYSVSGQRERMISSIGDISLGRDAGRNDGPAYHLESEEINRAIGALDASDVFNVSLGAASTVIAAIADSARAQARVVGSPRYDVTFDAREVLDAVLAALSQAWFGIKGKYFQPGSVDWAWKRGDPPLYPGHFTALSRYMFQPHPGPVPIELAQSYGKALTEAMLDFVNSHRAAGTTPERSPGRPAPIAAATFNHPMGSDPKFVASTMVGVLMGFTPTIIGAVLNVLREWHRDGTFATLRAACAGMQVKTLDDAMRLIHPAMATAAQMRPMPQIGWRTAREPHRLGPPGPHAVDVETGDKIVLAMVSGTQQSLQDGQPDGRLMFGGVRGPAGPTHACPGYSAAMAAMLGTLSALVAGSEEVRRGPAALTFEVRGTVALVTPVAPAVPAAPVEGP